MKILNNNKIVNIFHSLRTQLILYYMVISFVVLAAGAYFSYSYIMDLFQKNNEKYLLQQFSQADNNIQNVLDDVGRLSEIFYLDSNIQQYIQGNYESSELSAYETQKNILDHIGLLTFNYKYINSIYIQMKNGDAIGGNDAYTSIMREGHKNKFITAGMYEKVIEVFPKTIILGGITEDFYRNSGYLENEYVLSSARGVRAIHEPGRSAVLVLNIDEKYIASIYSSSDSLREGSTFLLDGTGKVVSGSSTKNIGNAYDMFSAIDTVKDYGSFTSSSSGLPMQVVYYRLVNSGFYLVGEIPLQYFTKDIHVLRKVLIIVTIVSFFAIFVITFVWMRKLTKPINMIAAKMSDVGKGNLGLTFSKIPKNEFGVVIKRFNEMSVNIADLIRKNDEIQEGKREMEIEALQYQINPHFLYNTLNMIKWMAANIKAKNIVDCTIALGNMLKPLFKSIVPMCTIKEELEYLENYVKIINWRFSNRVSFMFDIKEEFYNYKLPRFILQPIIENSINHGVQMDDMNIQISIDAFITDKGMINIMISDTGKGIDENKLAEINTNLENFEKSTQVNNKGSIGLYNINRRIKLNFGEKYGIRIRNMELGGAQVTVKLPAIQQ